MPLAAPVTSAFFPFRPSSGIGRAVEIDRDAGHVARVVAAESDDQRGGFHDRAARSHRDLLERSFRALLAAEAENLLQPAAGDDAGGDAVHPDAEAAELEGELAREPHHARLR